jgi:hypothetical protein
VTVAPAAAVIGVVLLGAIAVGLSDVGVGVTGVVGVVAVELSLPHAVTIARDVATKMRDEIEKDGIRIGTVR